MDRKQRMCEMEELFQLEFKKRMNESTAKMQKRFEDLAKKGIPRQYMYEIDTCLDWWKFLQFELQDGSERTISRWVSECRYVYDRFFELCKEIEESKKKKGGEPK